MYQKEMMNLFILLIYFDMAGLSNTYSLLIVKDYKDINTSDLNKVLKYYFVFEIVDSKVKNNNDK